MRWLPHIAGKLWARNRIYEKFGREVANGFGYDFPEEAYSFAVEQLKQLVRKARDLNQ
jgi:hypothetical protein